MKGGNCGYTYCIWVLRIESTCLRWQPWTVYDVMNEQHAIPGLITYSDIITVASLQGRSCNSGETKTLYGSLHAKFNDAEFCYFSWN
jgi:hypothetical protein